jgi:hypothetical protein
MADPGSSSAAVLILVIILVQLPAQLEAAERARQAVSNLNMSFMSGAIARGNVSSAGGRDSLHHRLWFDS